MGMILKTILILQRYPMCSDDVFVIVCKCRVIKLTVSSQILSLSNLWLVRWVNGEWHLPPSLRTYKFWTWLSTWWKERPSFQKSFSDFHIHINLHNLLLHSGLTLYKSNLIIASYSVMLEISLHGYSGVTAIDIRLVVERMGKDDPFFLLGRRHLYSML